MFELAGRMTPLVTPFTDDGASIGEVRIARLVRFYAERGAEGFAIATDTGEFTTLTFTERKQVVEWVQRSCQGSLPLVVNASTLATSSSLDIAQHAARHGARAVLLMPPYYGQFSQAEHVEHVRVVSAYSKLPVVVVDAQELLQEDAKTNISHIPNVHMAWNAPNAPFVATDWFRCYSLIVDPLAGVPGSTEADFVLRNRAAVAKTLLLDSDLEVGKPRMPVQPIPYREIRSAA